MLGASVNSQKYPEIDQAATIEKYKEMLKALDVSENISRIPLKSKLSGVNNNNAEVNSGNSS